MALSIFCEKRTGKFPVARLASTPLPTPFENSVQERIRIRRIEKISLTPPCLMGSLYSTTTRIQCLCNLKWLIPLISTSYSDAMMRQVRRWCELYLPNLEMNAHEMKTEKSFQEIHLKKVSLFTFMHGTHYSKNNM